MTTILVVDDDDVDLEAAGRCLQEIDDVDVRFARNGVEALESVDRDQPDVVLTDLRMPGMDGLELVERLTDEYPLVPVILMTARGSEQVAVRALEAGAASYVPKSDLEGELAETIEQVIEVSEANRSRARILRFLGRRETRFELSNDIQLITPLVAYFQDSMERLGFGNEALHTQIGIALMEAVANAMVRGNLEVGSELRKTDRDAYDRLVEARRHEEPYGSRTVSILAVESVASVQYIVEDQGTGFDPASIPDPTDAENLLAVSGRGMMLMRTFMDTVEYNEQGNCVTMSKANPQVVRPTAQPVS